MYRLVLATQPCTLASTTGYRVYRLVLTTQPCTLASTTGYSVPTGTGYTVLYTCFNLLVTKSTNRVLATQSLLYSASTQLVTQTKKKKKKSWLNIDQWLSKFMDDPSLLVFCYRELLVTVKYRVWSPGTGESYLRLIWLQRILIPVSGLGDMTVSLITPLNNLLLVLDLPGEIINFVIMSGQGSDISQMTIAL